MSREPDGVLRWNLAEISAALKITPEDVRLYFTDGRRVSFVLERRIAREILGGALATSEGAGYDLIDPKGGKWEVRSLTRGGIYFCPSYMVGSGRSFDGPGFLRKLAGVNGYSLTDIELFPVVPYWILQRSTVHEWWRSNRLGTCTKISREKALELVRLLP